MQNNVNVLGNFKNIIITPFFTPVFCRSISLNDSFHRQIISKNAYMGNYDWAGAALVFLENAANGEEEVKSNTDISVILRLLLTLNNFSGVDKSGSNDWGSLEKTVLKVAENQISSLYLQENQHYSKVSTILREIKEVKELMNSVRGTSLKAGKKLKKEINNRRDKVKETILQYLTLKENGISGFETAQRGVPFVTAQAYGKAGLAQIYGKTGLVQQEYAKGLQAVGIQPEFSRDRQKNSQLLETAQIEQASELILKSGEGRQSIDIPQGLTAIISKKSGIYGRKIAESLKGIENRHMEERWRNAIFNNVLERVFRFISVQEGLPVVRIPDYRLGSRRLASHIVHKEGAAEQLGHMEGAAIQPYEYGGLTSHTESERVFRIAEAVQAGKAVMSHEKKYRRKGTLENDVNNHIENNFNLNIYESHTKSNLKDLQELQEIKVLLKRSIFSSVLKRFSRFISVRDGIPQVRIPEVIVPVVRVPDVIVPEYKAQSQRLLRINGHTEVTGTKSNLNIYESYINRRLNELRGVQQATEISKRSIFRSIFERLSEFITVQEGIPFVTTAAHLMGNRRMAGAGGMRLKAVGPLSSEYEIAQPEMQIPEVFKWPEQEKSSTIILKGREKDIDENAIWDIKAEKVFGDRLIINVLNRFSDSLGMKITRLMNSTVNWQTELLSFAGVAAGIIPRHGVEHREKFFHNRKILFELMRYSKTTDVSRLYKRREPVGDSDHRNIFSAFLKPTSVIEFFSNRKILSESTRYSNANGVPEDTFSSFEALISKESKKYRIFNESNECRIFKDNKVYRISTDNKVYRILKESQAETIASRNAKFTQKLTERLNAVRNIAETAKAVKAPDQIHQVGKSRSSMEADVTHIRGIEREELLVSKLAANAEVEHIKKVSKINNERFENQERTINVLTKKLEAQVQMVKNLYDNQKSIKEKPVDVKSLANSIMSQINRELKLSRQRSGLE